jgi:hypothetical protein
MAKLDLTVPDLSLPDGNKVCTEPIKATSILTDYRSLCLATALGMRRSPDSFMLVYCSRSNAFDQDSLVQEEGRPVRQSANRSYTDGCEAWIHTSGWRRGVQHRRGKSGCPVPSQSTFNVRYRSLVKLSPSRRSLVRSCSSRTR